MLFLLASYALAVPMQFTHTGRMIDSAGLPLNGTQQVTFSLHNAATGGSQIWSETLDVDFDDGYFNEILGSDTLNNPLQTGNLDHPSVWIQAEIGGSALPRQVLTSIPYAYFADTAANVSGGIVDASEIRIGGNTVIDGGGQLVGTGDGDTLAALGCSAGELAVFNGAAWTCAPSSTGGSTGWADLVGVPPGFADDTDNDALSTLACATGQVAKWSASGVSWICADDIDTDTTLDEAAVDGFVSNNGYALSTDLATVATSGDYADLTGLPSLFSGDYGDLTGAPALASIATSGDWNDLGNVPAGLLDGTDDVLDEATVDAYANNNGYAMDADIATVGKTGAFSDLSGIPSGLSDGDDDTQLDEAAVDGFVSNNGYALASSLSALATSGDWSDVAGIPGDFADNVDNDTLDSLSCTAGDTVKWNGSDWVCSSDASACPSGWTNLGPVCIEDDLGGRVGTYRTAMNECYGKGARLCSQADLHYACDNRSSLGLSFTSGRWLWTDGTDYEYWGNGNYYGSYELYRYNGGSCLSTYTNPSGANHTFSWANWDNASSYGYTCCMNK